jgi:hypothetical protein
VSIGPGSESVGIEIYTAASVVNRWQRAVWSGDRWANPQWQAVECEVLEAEYRTGAGTESGVLSTAEAGQLDLRTYDPERLLDPMNTASPYFGAIKPGTPVRLMGKVPTPLPAWSGFLDEGRYQLASQQGRLRALDAIANLAQAELAEGASLPNTLRARVRAVVNAVGLGSLVRVQTEQPVVQLLVNGSFESSTTGWVNQGGGAGSGAVPVAGAPDGAHVLKVVGGAGYPQFEQTLPSAPGLSYTISGWVFRSAGLPGSIIPIARDAAGGLLLAAQFDGTFVGAWEYLSGTFVTPANTATVGIDLRIHAAATSAADAPLFDDIRMVGPDVSTITAPDPAVSAHDGKARSAWAIIQDAALDALTYVWIDPTGVLRFTPWGSLPDAKYAVGCPPEGETGGVWLEGLASLEDVSQGESIRNSVRSYSSGTTFGPAIQDPNSIAIFGERRLDVARVVPNAAVWAQRILDDRSDSGLEVNLGEVRPYTAAELALLLEGAADGPSGLRVADDNHGDPVDLTVAVVGAAVGVTEAGWRFRMVTMIPRAEWDQEVPPVEPPIPPPDPYHTETRVYVATSDALIALTSGGSNYGAGASSSLPVGAWSGWSYRALIQFPNIPGTKLRRLVSATLNLDTTDQVRIGFGSSPTIEVKRITGSWSAGSSSSPSSGNAVVWPGPATTGSIRSNVTTAQNAAVGIRVDGLVLPWLPASAGGSLAAQRGLALYAGSGSGADTTEFWPVEKGGSQRPELVLVLEVFD